MSSPSPSSTRTQIPFSSFASGEELVALSPGKRRPLYFDGRFLAASDLTQEQDYFLQRQRDFGRSAGSGVARGLWVTLGNGNRVPGKYTTDVNNKIRISSGIGVTQDGAIVSLDQDLQVDLSSVQSDMRRLTAQLGLQSGWAAGSSGSLSGVYIVALRPVEYSATPAPVYSSSLQASRELMDSDIVEAIAVTLLPFPIPPGIKMAECRAHAAQAIFGQHPMAAVPAGVLPLAMLGIEQNHIQWVDRFLVRRERVTAETDRLAFGLPIPPLADREAFLKQYDEQLLDIELPQGFNYPNSELYSASSYFKCLPPSGRLPARMVKLEDFTQRFFPEAMQVALTVAPEDEAALLVKESLSLPAIDLTASAEELAQVSVLIIIPVTRVDFQKWARSLPGDGQMPLQKLRPAGSNSLGGGTWLARVAAIHGLRPPRESGSTGGSVWNNGPRPTVDIYGLQSLYYIRRRWIAPESGVLSAAAVPVKKSMPQPS